MTFSIKRVLVMASRNILQLKRDPAKIIHIFYWSFLDIILWGYSATWIQQDSVSNSIGIALLTGVIFWQFVVRANFDISLGVLEEVLSHNITNLFASPLTLAEWISALSIISVLVTSILALYCYIITYLVYKISLVAVFGWNLLLFILLLFLAGSSFGFLAATLIITGGARFQSLVYMIGWLFAPLGGVFYPISVLPHWVQVIASWFPLMYIFDAMRNFINNQQLDWEIIIKALTLDVFYLIICAIIFTLAFKNSKKRGLSRLIE